jgi:dihydropteroate synthase
MKQTPMTPFGADYMRRTLIMGILNITPDSFSDGGEWAAHDAAHAHALAMAKAGADILDIGGESTRPGFTPVSAEHELARILPVIIRLRQEGYKLPISIDTMKAEVAGKALEAGASIINDVHGLQHDPDMAPVAAARGAGVIAMFHRAQIDDSLDIIAEAKAFFARSLAIADKAGIARERLLLDPGIGFGKSHRQNLILLRECAAIGRYFGTQMLLGASRKSFIGRIVESTAPQRVPGSLAAAVLSGAAIVRVHDVAETVQAMRVADAIRGADQAGQ